MPKDTNHKTPIIIMTGAPCVRLALEDSTSSTCSTATVAQNSSCKLCSADPCVLLNRVLAFPPSSPPPSVHRWPSGAFCSEPALAYHVLVKGASCHPPLGGIRARLRSPEIIDRCRSFSDTLALALAPGSPVANC